MKRTAFLISLLLCLPIPSRADDASKRVKTQEIFALLHMERLTEEMLNRVMKQTDNLSTQMVEKIGADKVTPEMKKQLADFRKQVFDLVIAQIGWKNMEPEYIDLYVRTYTEAELDAMLAFYKSPEGSSIVGKTSDVMAKSSELAQARLATIQPQLIAMLQEFAKNAAATAKGAGSSK